MNSQLCRVILAVAVAVATVGATTATAASDPTVKCAAAKQKAAGKKIAGKMSCISKAKAKNTATDPACLTKAEAKFTAAMNKAGGACPGSIAAIESLVDSCVNTLEPDAPGTGKCPSGTAKALGKAASAELSCSAKDL